MNTPTLGWLRLQAHYTWQLGAGYIADIPIIGIEARDGRIFLEAVKELHGEKIEQPKDPMATWIGLDGTESFAVKLSAAAATAFHPGCPGTSPATYRLYLPIQLQGDLLAAGLGGGRYSREEATTKEDTWQQGQ